MTTTPAQCIGGWLLGPLAWLLVALLSTSPALLLYVTAPATPQTFKTLGEQSTANLLLWGVPFAITIAMWYYTPWLTIVFFRCRAYAPKHYTLWLLTFVLLAIRAFAFLPVPDAFAVRQLLFSLLAAALLVPYFKRSQRVKSTFVNPWQPYS